MTIYLIIAGIVVLGSSVGIYVASRAHRDDDNYYHPRRP